METIDVLIGVNTILLSVIAFFMRNTYSEIKSVRGDVKIMADKQTEYIIKQLIMEKEVSTNKESIEEVKKQLNEIQRSK